MACTVQNSKTVSKLENEKNRSLADGPKDPCWLRLSLLAAVAVLAGCSDGGDDGGMGAADAADLDAKVAVADAAPSVDVPNGPACKAGDYKGPFDGAITVEGEEIEVEGVVELKLEQSGGDEFFDIVGGSISGTALGLFPFEGNLNGKLNCGAGMLEDGSIDDASVTVLEDTYFFEGTLDASYERFVYTFVDGIWSGSQTGGPPANASGAGSWTAAFED